MQHDPPRASLLLVDDRPENLLALEAILTPLGHELVQVRSGEEALAALKTRDFALISPGGWDARMVAEKR